MNIMKEIFLPATDGRNRLHTVIWEPDGVILAGTGSQPKPVLLAGMICASAIGAVKGERYRAKFLTNAAFSKYNARIDNPSSANDWISKDKEKVDAYNHDRCCSFMFTANGYKTLFETLMFIQEKKNIERIPRELPILMISGDADPVGDYGRGVRRVYATYKRAGIKDIRMKLYKDDRHELVNETDRKKVFADVMKWIRLHGDYDCDGKN